MNVRPIAAALLASLLGIATPGEARCAPAAASLTVGGLNVFDVYPDEWDKVNAFPFPQLGFRYGWETLPFGVNGGYYFARLNFRL